jgi:hypothetical protein
MSGFVHGNSKGVATNCVIGKLPHWLDLDSGAAGTLGQTYQTGVGHVPTTTKEKEVAAL